MKFKSYVGKRVVVREGKEILFGADTYETTDEQEIEALKKALEVVQVGGDGTDGSGRKVKLSSGLTLEPETSPEADNIAVTQNTSDAELLLDAVHEKDGGPVFTSDSTHAANVAEEKFRSLNNGKLTTQEANAIDEKLKNPKK